MTLNYFCLKNEQGRQLINQSTLQDTYRQTSNGGAPSLASRKTRARFPAEYVTFTYGMGWRNGMYRGKFVYEFIIINLCIPYHPKVVK